MFRILLLFLLLISLLWISSSVFGISAPSITSSLTSVSVSVRAFVTGQTYATTTFNVSNGGSYTFNTVANNNYCDLTFAPDYYNEPLELRANSYSNTFFATSRPAPSGKNFIGKTYNFDLVTSSGSQVTAVNKAVTIVYTYSDADVSGIDESTLVPYRWGQGDSAWQLISGGTVDTENNEVAFSTTRFSSFVLLGSPSTAPADVQIIEITDKVIPAITANVRIDNMGTSASDFYYVYCIVASADNLCGGNDDIDSGSDTAYINAGSFINLSLTLDEVPAVGTYWFKVKVRALAETNWAASSEQFVAEVATVIPPVTPPISGGLPGGAGAGGGGGATPAVIIPTTTASSCNGADFNGDKKVNSIDFSILLAFWQKRPPFKNPCVDINKDNKVNFVDFSILLYQWKK